MNEKSPWTGIGILVSDIRRRYEANNAGTAGRKIAENADQKGATIEKISYCNLSDFIRMIHSSHAHQMHGCFIPKNGCPS